MKNQTVINAKLTLGDFLLREMRQRDMSARKFAELVGVRHAVINKFLNHGINEFYGKQRKPVGDPGIEFLVKLSKATGKDVCALIALVWPDAIRMDAYAAILAQEISKLPESQRESLDSWAFGVTLKSKKKDG